MSPVVSPLSDRRVDLAPEIPGLVEAVAPASLAAELGIEPGDRVLSVNDRPLVDALDFQFHAQAERVVLDIEGDVAGWNLRGELPHHCLLDGEQEVTAI
jgi:S1-C subfamily serine protease